MKSMDIFEALTDMNDEMVLLPEAQSKKTKSACVRWLKWTAVAAAACISLMITACAADTVFNDGKVQEEIFGTKPIIIQPQKKPSSTKPVTNNKGTTDVLTSNGATVTPISAYHDGKVCFLQIRLEAPEGVVLEDLPQDKKYRFSDEFDFRERVEVEFTFETHEIQNEVVKVLPDEDPTDNVKDFLLELHADSSWSYYGKAIKIRIPGLWVRGVFPYETKNLNENIFKADFEFKIELNSLDEKINLKNIDKTLYVEEHDFSVNLEQLIITPLRVEVYYTATLPEDENILPDGSYAQLVMKDGSTLTFGDVSEVSDGPDVGYHVLSKEAEYLGVDAEKFIESVYREGHTDYYRRYTLDEPLDLSQIDYILWCGGQIIDVK